MFPDINLTELTDAQAVFMIYVAVVLLWIVWRKSLPLSKKLPIGVPNRRFWARLCDPEDSEITAAAAKLGLRSGGAYPTIHGCIQSALPGHRPLGLLIQPAIGTYAAWLNPRVETEFSAVLGVPVVIYPTQYPPYWRHVFHGSKTFPRAHATTSKKGIITVRWGEIPEMPKDARRVDTYPDAPIRDQKRPIQ